MYNFKIKQNTLKQIKVLMIILCVILLILFLGEKLLTQYSAACQGLGALANVGIVYFIYIFSRNDSVSDLKKETDRRWYLEIIIPKFIEQVDTFINIEIDKTRRLINNRSNNSRKKKLLQKIITESCFDERKLLNNIVYFDKNLYNDLSLKIDEFNDALIEDIANNITNNDYIERYINNIIEHRNNIIEILYIFTKNL